MDILRNTAGTPIVWNGTPLGTTWAGGAPGPSYPTDYIAFYKFEDDVTDETGNYNASIVGSWSPTYSTGLIGKCIEGAPSGGKYINTGIKESVIGTEWTLCMWIKRTDASDPLNGGLFATATSDSQSSMYIGISRGNHSSYPGAIIMYTTPVWQYTISTERYDDGDWHLICARRDSSDISVSLDNGSEILSDTTSTTSSQDMIFAKYNGSFTNGFIDQAIIYDRVLNTTEESQIWNGGSGV